MIGNPTYYLALHNTTSLKICTNFYTIKFIYAPTYDLVIIMDKLPYNEDDHSNENPVQVYRVSNPL